jgi:LuxR family transcriptional regulator, quorum-sensing system regulator BjaR1
MYAATADCEGSERPPRALSRRQREVLQWAAVGKTDWEIGVILSISEKAVKFHVMVAREKLNAANRTHAVALALTQGMINPP